MASNAEKPVKKKDALVRESESSKSLDAVLVGAVLLFGISAALFAADRMSRAQRMQWTAGSIGGAVGLMVGYGVGRLRP